MSKKYKVELTIDLNENWTGDNPNDWDWQTLLDVGDGMELDEVRIWDELVWEKEFERWLTKGKEERCKHE